MLLTGAASSLISPMVCSWDGSARRIESSARESSAAEFGSRPQPGGLAWLMDPQAATGGYLGCASGTKGTSYI